MPAIDILTCQRHLFDLTDDQIFLNGAYMSPQLKSVQNIGIEHLKLKARPWQVTPEHFYDRRQNLKEAYAKLIETSAENIAIVPSVSYGMANVANNIQLSAGDEIIMVEEQFPSNVYTWQEVANRTGAVIKTVAAPSTLTPNRGQQWNQAILDVIGPKTAVVTLAHVHWADGTLYHLKAIREASKAVGAKLVIDGTQSVGALPFSIQEIQPDALICGGYKWLMGAYSLGLAYMAEDLHEGIPIEHNWFNRYKSEDFQSLTKYQDKFQPGAERFSVGESSNFIQVPMLTEAINQILKWQPSGIQKYCADITSKAITNLKNQGFTIEDPLFRSNHLFGIYLPEHLSLDDVKQVLSDHQIHVSYRGTAIRVSPHVYNREAEMLQLLEALGTLT